MKLHSSLESGNFQNVNMCSLGFRQTADAQKITERYRLLMKLNHPDLGGSPFIAQKVNEAKELLLKSKKTN